MAKKKTKRNIMIGGLVLVWAVFFYFIFFAGEAEVNVKFRTTDLNYGSGSSIAYDVTNGSCGTELKALGFDWTEDLGSHTCQGLFGRQTFPVPCSWNVDDCKAYISVAGNYQEVSICSEKAHKYSTYLNSKPATIDISSLSINPNFEVIC